ncbi:MAG: 30S ribosomal protein S2 [Candidatus Liptonbacteria bacterium]|nr:30S ribosomal protein S2 [Candidatus Liptonbacteria bacterium]
MDEVVTSFTSTTPEMEAAIKEMIAAGVFYGRKKNQTCPRMKQYVLHNRNGVEIINLSRTYEELNEALEFLKSRVVAGAPVLLVATQPQLQDLVNAIRQRLNIPVVFNRWIGGTLTNFKIIAQRIEHFRRLKRDMSAGVFAKYTKKEQVMISKEIERLDRLFAGIENLERLPSVMVVIDPIVHGSAVREARRMNIPIVAFANVDTNPAVIERLVPGNTKARQSVSWFLEKVEPILAGATRAPAVAASVPGAKTESTYDISDKANVTILIEK